MTKVTDNTAEVFHFLNKNGGTYDLNQKVAWLIKEKGFSEQDILKGIVAHMTMLQKEFDAENPEFGKRVSHANA